MCDIWRNTTKEEIGADEVAQWLPEWRRLGVRRVVMSGGEPLMHSRFWDLLDLLREAGIGITLLSTGILLRRHAEKVVEYCDDVVVSLDGPRPVHDRIRNLPAAFDKLADGVRAVKGANKAVRVSGRCTVQRMNYRSLRETVAAAHAMGLDAVSFLAADVSTDAFNRPQGWEPHRVDEVALQPEDLPQLMDELNALQQECAQDFEEHYIVESAAKLTRRIYQYFAALVGEADFAPIECNAPWVSTVIEADGTVRPCYFQQPLGNIRDAASLDDVLNSPSALAWRRGLDMTRDEICRKCVCSLALRESAGLVAPSSVT
jgi:MoaA/NifB/PqqE/SkfB family radical SAM enzyme